MVDISLSFCVIGQDIFGTVAGEDRKKHLTIRYEIEGNQGKVHQLEVDGHLLKPLEVTAAG